MLEKTLCLRSLPRKINSSYDVLDVVRNNVSWVKQMCVVPPSREINCIFPCTPCPKRFLFELSSSTQTGLTADNAAVIKHGLYQYNHGNHTT